MHTLSLAGLAYQAHSPSHFTLQRAPAAIAFDGQGWRIATHRHVGHKIIPVARLARNRNPLHVPVVPPRKGRHSCILTGGNRNRA